MKLVVRKDGMFLSARCSGPRWVHDLEDAYIMECNGYDRANNMAMLAYKARAVGIPVVDGERVVYLHSRMSSMKPYDKREYIRATLREDFDNVWGEGLPVYVEQLRWVK